MSREYTEFNPIANRPLTKSEKRDIYTYVTDIINHLTPAAIAELMEGYENDVEELLYSMMRETHRIINVRTKTIDPETIDYLPNMEKVFDEVLKINSFNYFKISMLPNFEMSWRNIEWGNLAQMNRWSCFLCQRGSGKSHEFCFAFPLWRAWSYRMPRYGMQNTVANRNCKEIVIITNETRLGWRHLAKISDEISSNEFLQEVMMPADKSNLGKEIIRTKNGSTIFLRSKDSFIRGLHVGTVVVDDLLDKSCLYSKEQREKYEEVFYAEIVNIVESGGYLTVCGTPFHEKDLYHRIRKDPHFKTFIYPGIYPDGKLLAPDRYTLKEVLELRESLGSIVFSREHLVKPVSDQSSLFPWEYLNRAKEGMEHFTLVQNIESFPIKMERVVIGCDFAISGNIGADYSVFSVWGKAADNGKYYLLNIFRRKGMSHGNQVAQIVSMYNRFHPNVIIAENNGFQRIMIDMIKEKGVTNVEGFTTEANIKRDLYEGLPSLSAMFERGEIKIPYGNEESRNVFDWLCGEFNSITMHEDTGKLESTSDHDDGAMSTFFAVTNLREKKTLGSFKVHYI